MVELIESIATIGVTFVLLAVAVSVILLFWVLWKVAKDEFEEENPCETCLRWVECNGVDKDCPLRKR